MNFLDGGYSMWRIQITTYYSNLDIPLSGDATLAEVHKVIFNQLEALTKEEQTCFTVQVKKEIVTQA